MVWLMFVLVAVIAFLVGSALRRNPEPEPEVRTFGLEEARAAREFIQTPEQAKAVKAVVVGVLSFEDTVAKEAEDAAEDLMQAKGSNERRIDVYLKYIVDLNAEIASLQNANVAIDAQRDDLNSLSRLFA